MPSKRAKIPSLTESLRGAEKLRSREFARENALSRQYFDIGMRRRHCILDSNRAPPAHLEWEHAAPQRQTEEV